MNGQLRDAFWTLTIDAHLLRAAINWCMVFGSDKHEPTHWKMLAIANLGKLKKASTMGFLKRPVLMKRAGRNIRTKVTYFRNKFAVHRELAPETEPLPNFDGALQVAFYFDRWASAGCFTRHSRRTAAGNFR